MRGRIVLAISNSWKCDHCTIQITHSPYNDLPLAFSTSLRKSVGFYYTKCALRTSITDGAKGTHSIPYVTESQLK